MISINFFILFRSLFRWLLILLVLFKWGWSEAIVDSSSNTVRFKKFSQTEFTEGISVQDSFRLPENYLSVVVKAWRSDSKNSQKFFLEFDLQVKKPYHINSYEPLDDFLIPTVLTISKVSFHQTIERQDLDWRVTYHYPQGKVRKLRADETLVSVYEGSGNKIISELDVTQEGLGEKKLNSSQLMTVFYEINFQPCDEEVCFPPVRLKGKTDVDLGSLPKKNDSNFSENIFSLADFLRLILFALLGGFLLNLMPCVLPVLSLKIFSLIKMKESKKPDEAKSGLRKNLFFYQLGVILTFLLFGVFVSGVKLIGEQIGWGFQFQNPSYLAFMIIFLYFIALSFWGFFDAFLSISLEDSRSGKKWGESVENFMFGFLMVVLATPCLAPFLGIAAGFALSQSWGTIIIFYLLVALGFISPYIVFMISPSLLRWMPRPRGWMNWVKPLLAFPLLGTVLWLVSIYEAVTLTSPYYVVGFLILIALLLFILKIVVYTDHRILKMGLWMKFSFGLLILSLAVFGLMSLDSSGSFNQIQSDDESIRLNTPNKFKEKKESQERESWQSFSREAIESSLQSGHIVYLHFTADWCLNCRVNEKLVLNQKKTAQLFDRFQVVKFIADWTREDKKIYREIRRLGRAGIPLDVMYFPQSLQSPLEPVQTTDQKVKEKGDGLNLELEGYPFHIFNEIMTYDELEKVLKNR